VDAVTIKPEMLAVDDHNSTHSGSSGADDVNDDIHTSHTDTLPLIITTHNNSNGNNRSTNSNSSNNNMKGRRDSVTSGDGDGQHSGNISNLRTKRSRSMSPSNSQSNRKGNTNTNNSTSTINNGTSTVRTARTYVLPHRDDHQWTCPKGCGKVIATHIRCIDVYACVLVC
jgi:hypothetical protein